MAYNTYYPEMDEAAPAKSDGTASLSHYGKHYFIDTRLELSGRGVRFVKTYQPQDLVPKAQHKVGTHCYQVTLAAFKKLCTQYDFTGEILLD